MVPGWLPFTVWDCRNDPGMALLEGSPGSSEKGGVRSALPPNSSGSLGRRLPEEDCRLRFMTRETPDRVEISAERQRAGSVRARLPEAGLSLGTTTDGGHLGRLRRSRIPRAIGRDQMTEQEFAGCPKTAR